MAELLTLRADCSPVTSKPDHSSPYLPSGYLVAPGNLGESSNKLGSIFGNQGESSNKSANAMVDAASRAEASIQLVERGMASSTMKKCRIARNTSGAGNLSEFSSNCFLGENSNKRPSAQHLRSNIHPIYQDELPDSPMKASTQMT
jgi:hypothetical protein